MQTSLQLRKFKSITLLTCSIINIVSCVVCVALEDAHPFIGKGVWSGAFYIVTGFLGYSASYTPTRPLIITTVVFSSFSICIAIAVSILSAVCSIECSGEHIIKECHMQPIEVTLAIVSLVAVINNVVVTSSLKKFTCCSLGKPNETTVQLDQETCRPCPIHQCQSTTNYQDQSSMELPPPAYSSLVFESNDLPTNA